ncbi:HYR domain-containing protein [Seonamhaeicola algicola]|uniref:HYR domain-containing protein n=1 Tax=Seonamhaeicola algicola TaxID=1719036 RepID=A0A5C7B341_9FLAO|nr:HYR domain-containing protein [Seonamhaeicola algicola]TXE15151.1 HYR domain-containing protein [Seonamhaeicola algicola]
MIKQKLIFISCLTAGLLITNCSSSNDDNNTPTADTVKPTINCPETITISVDNFTTETTVTYTTPVGTDDNDGAITTQISGIASGELFPLGTTTNTFEVKDAAGNTSTCSFDVVVSQNTPSENMPFFVETNYTPNGKKWVKVDAMSDEFNSTNLDETKWKNTDPNQWIGRPPGLFKKNTVSVENGYLKLTADILPEPETVNGKEFTHAGSYITSLTSIGPGHYFECRMKASKTFMSSTFWLINKRNEGSGCERRVTEFDIQECVGEITTDAAWAQSFDNSMHSNTHSRNADCTETPTGSNGNSEDTSSKVYDEFHVYAGWWKSPTEVELFLDGIKVGTVTPPSNFDLPMYMKMVVETYDWNPVPNGGGMNGTAEERTTSYDWVRTWKLEDQ